MRIFLTAMAALLTHWNSAVAGEAPQITQAFGIAIGKELRPENITRSNGIERVLNPPNPHSSFTQYRAFVSMSGRVTVLMASGKTDGQRACEMDAENIAINYLSKYQQPFDGPRDGNPYGSTYFKVWTSKIPLNAVEWSEGATRHIEISCTSERDHDEIKSAPAGKAVPWKTVIRFKMHDFIPPQQSNDGEAATNNRKAF